MIKQKFLSSFNFSLYEKCVPNIFMVSKSKSTHCIPQTATLTSFRTLIPEISSFIELTSFRKTVVHQQMRNIGSNYQKLLTHLNGDFLWQEEIEFQVPQ